jgi:hypothetical protein
LSSGTLAELYFEQGLPGRAVEVYRKVLEAEPRNEAVRARVAEIEAVSGPSSPTEGGERATRRRAIERTIQRLEEMLAVLHGR